MERKGGRKWANKEETERKGRKEKGREKGRKSVRKKEGKGGRGLRGEREQDRKCISQEEFHTCGVPY